MPVGEAKSDSRGNYYIGWPDPAVSALSPGRVVSVCYFIIALFQTSFKYI